MSDHVVAPAPPYALLQSTRGGDPTRRVRDGVLEMVFEVDVTPVFVQVWQRPDGALVARLPEYAPPGTLELLRFVLACDVDHGPFLDLARSDPLLGGLVSQRRGLRPARTATVTHAMLKAFAGQLITAREARAIEHRIIMRFGRRHHGLMLPPTADDLRRAPAVDLVRCGLAPRRASALARVVRTLDLERLRAVPADHAVARLERERTIGPWSSGLVAFAGLGSMNHGFVGDLGLVRLASNLLGRPATPEDTQRLVAPYAPWSGLAAAHLMGHPLARQRTTRAA